MKKALITGCTGQDGSYLAEALLDIGYEVHGMVRRVSVETNQRIKHLDKLILHYGDLTDSASIYSLISALKPDEVYNLAAQSHVGTSFEVPVQTFETNALGVLHFLEAIRKFSPTTRFYQASTSEMFGDVAETPQTEKTPFRCRSPYGVSKLAAYWLVRNYRDSYKLHASNGILFNHESPRRGEKFVTRKVVKELIEVWKRQRDCVFLGNMDAKRDWGYAPDYVYAMYLMLQKDMPDDYVIATGETHTVRELVEVCGKLLGMDIKWSGFGECEVGYFGDRVVVKVDPQFYRPSDVEFLCGNPAKAKALLNWEPSVRFRDLVKIMVEAELNGTN